MAQMGNNATLELALLTTESLVDQLKRDATSALKNVARNANENGNIEHRENEFISFAARELLIYLFQQHIDEYKLQVQKNNSGHIKNVELPVVIDLDQMREHVSGTRKDLSECLGVFLIAEGDEILRQDGKVIINNPFEDQVIARAQQILRSFVLSVKPS